MRNYGVLLTLFLCCGWPLIVHGAIVYLSRNAASIRWDLIRWPWSKRD